MVRTADTEDVAAIADLRSLWTGDPSGAEFERHVSDWLSDEGDRRTIWLAWVTAQPVGMASLFEYRRMPQPGRPASSWGYVGNMFVREEFRSRGVGSALMAALITAAEQRGYARLVLSPSDEGVRFYQRAGFVVPDESAGGDRLLVRPTPDQAHTGDRR